jgi:hypothetical protein
MNDRMLFILGERIFKFSPRQYQHVIVLEGCCNVEEPQWEKKEKLNMKALQDLVKYLGYSKCY